MTAYFAHLHWVAVFGLLSGAGWHYARAKHRHPTTRPPRAWVRTAGFTLLWTAGCVAVVGYGQVVNGAADRLTLPAPRLPVQQPDAPEQYGWRRVRFTAVDGVPLVGWWVSGPTPRTVVIVHGHGDNKGTYVPLLHWLRSEGWSAFAFDLRTHGESGGRVATLGVHEQRDLEAALAVVTAQQARMPDGADAPLVVFAYSLGGTVATPVVARDTRVDGYVIEGTSPHPLRSIARVARGQLGRATPFVLPPAYALVYARTGAWIPGLRTLDAMAHVSPRPVLVILGLQDGVPAEAVRELYAAAGEPKQLFEAPRSRHVAAFFDDHAAYTAEVRTFLTQVTAAHAERAR